MSGFSVDWLNLREPADQRARNSGLLNKAVAFLVETEGSSESEIVVDLGAGTGSSFRAMQPLLASHPKMQTWRLIDNDPVLLAEAMRRLQGKTEAEACEQNLNHIDVLPLTGVRMVTASALFDLVSASYIDQLVTKLAEAAQNTSLCFCAALNYDGTTQWDPVHPLDTEVLNAFNRDQQTDKGFGPALGPAACNYMQQALEEAGFTVELASSPWKLDAEDAELVAELIQGIAAAVRSDPEMDARAVDQWVEYRIANSQTGRCTVGHTDLLAILAK